LFGSWNEFIVYMGDDPQKVPRFDRQHQKRHPSEKELIQEYFKIRKILGRKLSAMEVTKYGKYTQNVYLHKWGTWNNFLKEIKEDTRGFRKGAEPYSDENIIIRYENVKKYLRHIPTLEEINIKDPNLYPHILKHFGGLEEFRKSRNEYISPIIKDDDLIKRYEKVKESVKRIPRFRDIKINDPKLYPHILRRFGSLVEFRKSRNENIGPIITDEELIKRYENVKESVKHIPKIKDINIKDPKLYRLLIIRFGGLEEIRKMRNEKSKLDDVPDIFLGTRLKIIKNFLTNHGGVKTFQKVHEMLNDGKTIEYIAKELKLSKRRTYRIVDNLFQKIYVPRPAIKEYLESYMSNIQKEQTVTSEWIKNI
jgi:hypothetical protein